jgi:acyl-[acyl-carrier-protein]-phospholipid O-acyltransferase/long-chain-fatty-acid--[acyl-carrier-protein] ligase
VENLKNPVAIIFDQNNKPLIFTHTNILAQVNSLDHIFFNRKRDLLFASLPFHTIDGLILGIWLPLFMGLEVVYGKERDMNGKSIQEAEVTFLATSTESYRKLFSCSKPYHLSSIRYAIVLDGGMTLEEIQAYEENFGIDLLEGYSIPELSGFVSLNHKSYRGNGMEQIAKKPGTVGQPIPGTCAKILDPKTLEPLLPGQRGILHFKSPGKSVDGNQWYNTNLWAMMDEAGFIILESNYTQREVG